MGRREIIGEDTVRGEHFRVLDDGKALCELCPRGCRMSEGQRGFCFIRQAQRGQVVLTSYGRASGFCIDPIEKKPLNHFYPGSSVLSFGTAGCNLGCRFCQNWDISKAKEDARLTDQAGPDDIAAAAERASVKSIAFTYNDPVIWAEYAIDCAEAAHERGIKTVAVTAGYIHERARARFFAPMDAANVDLKAFSEGFYEKLCFAQLAPVLETLAWLKQETQVWLEVTTLLIPGHNDSEAEVASLSEWCVEHLGEDTPLHFTAFHPDFKLTSIPPTPPSTLLRARAQARAAGLRHVYTGNVRDPASQSTYCAQCGACVIARDGYVVDDYALTADARCLACGTVLAGHFDAGPAHWGRRRVRLPITRGVTP